MATLEASLVLDILFHKTSLHCASLVLLSLLCVYVAVSVALLIFFSFQFDLYQDKERIL